MLYCPLSSRTQLCYFFFFFNDTATTEIYTLSLHDALPICVQNHHRADEKGGQQNNRKRAHADEVHLLEQIDRKSTRLNSSHGYISYAVFCLKKKKKHERFAHDIMTVSELNTVDLHHSLQ